MRFCWFLETNFRGFTNDLEPTFYTYRSTSALTYQCFILLWYWYKNLGIHDLNFGCHLCLKWSFHAPHNKNQHPHPSLNGRYCEHGSKLQLVWGALSALSMVLSVTYYSESHIAVIFFDENVIFLSSKVIYVAYCPYNLFVGNKWRMYQEVIDLCDPK